MMTPVVGPVCDSQPHSPVPLKSGPKRVEHALPGRLTRVRPELEPKGHVCSSIEPGDDLHVELIPGWSELLTGLVHAQERQPAFGRMDAQSVRELGVEEDGGVNPRSAGSFDVANWLSERSMPVTSPEQPMA